MRKTHRSYILTVSMAICALAACTVAQDLPGRVDEYMQAQAQVNRFSGSVLIAREGKMLVAKGYGLANAEWNIPNSSGTKFRLGSITKQFTSMAVMQLQEWGKLSVRNPICKYFADCPKAWEPVTIHHLLTHTSGIPSYTDMPDYQGKMMIPASKEEMIARFRSLPLEFPAGEKFHYDNSGYFLLGMIIEKVASKPYEDVLREQIFDPLGMKNTGYDHSEIVLPNRASGYANREGKLINAAFLDMGQPYAAGSLYSTVEDLLIWDQALYTERILPGKALETIFTPFKENYAYGWTVRTVSNRKLIGHGGGINGFSSSILRYPEQKVTVIVLSNLESGNAGRVANDLSAIVFGEKYEVPRGRVEARVDPRLFDAFVGEYQLAPNFSITVTREGDRLMTQATGQPKVEVYPESETRFFLKVVDAQITFVKDEKGNVTQLVLHQGGADRPAKKIR